MSPMSDTFDFCAREATQIFGGLAYTKGGQGEVVERLYRSVTCSLPRICAKHSSLDCTVRFGPTLSRKFLTNDLPGSASLQPLTPTFYSGGSSEIMIDLGMRQSVKIAEIMGYAGA